jgi:hypothetical protein
LQPHTFLLKDANVILQLGEFNTLWSLVIEWNLSENAAHYEGCSNETCSRVQHGRDARATVMQQIQWQARELSAEEIHQLMCQWDAWLNTHED